MLNSDARQPSTLWFIHQTVIVVISDSEAFQTAMQTAYSSKYEVDLMQMPLVEEIPTLFLSEWATEIMHPAKYGFTYQKTGTQCQMSASYA